MAHIDDLLFLGDTQVVFDILSSCVVRQPFYLIQTLPSSSSFLYLSMNFDKKVMQVCGDIMGPWSRKFIEPFNKASNLTINLL
jgi:hypothetical protein